MTRAGDRGAVRPGGAGACVVLAAMAGACGGHEERLHRNGSAAPVVAADPVPSAGSDGSARVTGEEVEPNDVDELATPLPLGAVFHGKLEPGDADVDRFRIDVARTGALRVMVTDVDNSAVVLDVEDADGNQLAHSDRGGTKVPEGVPNLGVAPGRYFAVVHGRPRPKPTGRHRQPEPPAPPIGYHVTADMVALEPHAEVEPDDDRATATDILVGDQVTGYLGWDHDVDVWKLSIEGVSGRTALDIEVQPLNGVALELEVGDGSGQAIAVRKVARNWPAKIRGLVPVLTPQGSPFHYLTVHGTGSNPEVAYQLSVHPAALAGNAEVEPDDSLDHPFVVPPELSVIPATWTPGDVDYYFIGSGQPAHTLDVGLEEPANLDLSLDVLADGKVVQTLAHAHAPADHLAVKLPPDVRVVVRVRGPDHGDRAPPEGPYKLRIDRGLP
jgi:hypothetical protein